MNDNFITFMKAFKSNLSEIFPNCDLDSWDYLVNIAGTGGWVDALKSTSEEHMTEVFALWDELNWWSADLFDSWLIDCAEWLGLCKKNGGTEDE